MYLNIPYERTLLGISSERGKCITDLAFYKEDFKDYFKAEIYINHVISFSLKMHFLTC